MHNATAYKQDIGGFAFNMRCHWAQMRALDRRIRLSLHFSLSVGRLDAPALLPRARSLRARAATLAACHAHAI